MHRFSQFLRRAAEVIEMTEPEAYVAYTSHTRECTGCTDNDVRCKVGARLFETWSRAASAQGAGTQASGPTRRRPRARAGRR